MSIIIATARQIAPIAATANEIVAHFIYLSVFFTRARMFYQGAEKIKLNI